MQIRRRFQPMVDGLPYRIAPSSVAAVTPPTVVAPPSAGMPIITAFDTSMPEGGTSTPIIVAPPTTSGGGTILC
jgi:hypothetical protein